MHDSAPPVCGAAPRRAELPSPDRLAGRCQTKAGPRPARLFLSAHARAPFRGRVSCSRGGGNSVSAAACGRSAKMDGRKDIMRGRADGQPGVDARRGGRRRRSPSVRPPTFIERRDIGARRAPPSSPPPPPPPRDGRHRRRAQHGTISSAASPPFRRTAPQSSQAAPTSFFSLFLPIRQKTKSLRSLPAPLAIVVVID